VQVDQINLSGIVER